jgi:hypothetical protein
LHGPAGRAFARCSLPGTALEPERIEKGLLAATARQPLRLLGRIAQVQPHAPVTLREREEVRITLRADRLPIGGPAVGTFDQHA